MLVSSFKPLCIFSLCSGFCKKREIYIYIFKFQTYSKYVRLIVANEIMNLNRKKIDAKFSFPAHHILGKFVLKLSPLLAGIFYCLCNFKTMKNSSGHLKCTANFTMQLMQLFSPENSPTKDLFSVTQKTFVSPKRNWKQCTFAGNTNCTIDSYIEHRQQCTLFPPSEFCTAIFFDFSRDDCNTLGKWEL